MTTDEFQSVKGALRPLLGIGSVQKEAVLDTFFTEDHSQKVLLSLPIPDMHHSISVSSKCFLIRQVSGVYLMLDVFRVNRNGARPMEPQCCS